MRILILQSDPNLSKTLAGLIKDKLGTEAEVVTINDRAEVMRMIGNGSATFDLFITELGPPAGFDSFVRIVRMNSPRMRIILYTDCREPFSAASVDSVVLNSHQDQAKNLIRRARQLLAA